MGEGLWGGKAVVALPVEVPVGNEDEFFCGAIGEFGPAVTFVAEVVQVGPDGEEVGIHGEGVRGLDGVVALACWNINGRGAEEERVEVALGWFFAEIESDARLDGLGFSARAEVELEDDVGALAEEP